MYINKNVIKTDLSGLINTSTFTPKIDTKDILEDLEKILSFNRSLVWKPSSKNMHLVNSMESLLEVFKLRSKVFGDMGYLDEFPDPIKGLNFDKFDEFSGITYYKRGDKISATCRMIFDSKYGLPSEGKISFNEYRKKGLFLGEISRNIVDKSSGGLNLEFKSSMASMYDIFIHNDLDLTLSGMVKSNFKLFSKLGGTKIEHELKAYGEIEEDCIIISWDFYKTNKFFEKAFLR